MPAVIVGVLNRDFAIIFTTLFLSSNIGWYAVWELYGLLEELYNDYIKWEDVDKVEFEKDLDETKRQFLENEARN